MYGQSKAEMKAARTARNNPGTAIEFYLDNGDMGWVTYDADSGYYDIIRRKCGK